MTNSRTPQKKIMHQFEIQVATDVEKPKFRSRCLCVRALFDQCRLAQQITIAKFSQVKIIIKFSVCVLIKTCATQNEVPEEFENSSGNLGHIEENLQELRSTVKLNTVRKSLQKENAWNLGIRQETF